MRMGWNGVVFGGWGSRFRESWVGASLIFSAWCFVYDEMVYRMTLLSLEWFGIDTRFEENN
jgi:hypothetical protein